MDAPIRWCPANAVATVGQTSLLGSMHLAFGPAGRARTRHGRLKPRATIPLTKTSTYPSTEQTPCPRYRW